MHYRSTLSKLISHFILWELLVEYFRAISTKFSDKYMANNLAVHNRACLELAFQISAQYYFAKGS
jgi:hypothetical protein